MSSYARRFDWCLKRKDEVEAFWTSCDAIAKGDSLRIAQEDGLMFVRKVKEDGSTSYGYAIVTGDRRYARKLAKEFKQLDLVESERFGGDVIYTDAKNPSLQLMRQETATLAQNKLTPVWVFVVKRKAT
ncbi:MAG: hypothetical protein IPM12_09015 [Flavobacteriales bacterium]|nr:hypothetical protein [Flavobacteriales bacterium]